MIGSYKILKTLGEGGFGRTYVGEHSILNKKVVIKQSLFKSPAAQKIIIDEAKLLWDINHWALPTVKDVIINNSGDVIMVMSFIEGEQLHEHVKKSGFVNYETACWIAQRILSALYYLHFEGIVHRDIKPANIIVNFDTHIATLVDFGLSKLRPDGSPDLSGYTPYFGSPEQIDGKPPIPESDIYSLGMTLLYITGGDIQAKSLPDNMPDRLKDFILPMINENPLKRPNNCKELNQNLSNIREDLFKRGHSI